MTSHQQVQEGASEPDDFRLCVEGKITSEEYVRRLTERVRTERGDLKRRDVVPREVAEPLVEAYDHLIHERREYAIVCIEHALVALGVDPATATSKAEEA